MLDRNLLIQGDAVATMDRLLPSLGGRVDLVYIDPPYNTGARIDAGGEEVGYDDDRDHAEWLALMRATLVRIRDLLAPTGSLMVHLDDNELDYLKVAADGVFGRRAFLNRVTIDARSPSSFSTVNRGVFKSSEYLLWYARDRDRVRIHPQRVPRPPDRAYNMFLENPGDPHEQWRFSTVTRACPPRVDRDRFQVEFADRVCRLATISDQKAGRSTVEAKRRSRRQPERVLRVDRPGLEPRYVLRGQQLIFYDRQVVEIDGRRTASRPLSDIWTDMSWEGLAREGGVTFRKGKKPERLLRRVLQLTTAPGDLVLDCFLGSGSTAAVAHKMGRRWVGIEAGAHAKLAIERMERVVAGEDPTGVTEVTGWAGGGDFEALTLKALAARMRSGAPRCGKPPQTASGGSP